MFELEDLIKLQLAVSELVTLKTDEKRCVVEESKLMKLMASMTDCDPLYEWAYDFERDAELSEEEMEALEWDRCDIDEVLEDRRIYAQESS